MRLAKRFDLLLHMGSAKKRAAEEVPVAAIGDVPFEEVHLCAKIYINLQAMQPPSVRLADRVVAVRMIDAKLLILISLLPTCWQKDV